MKEILVVCEGNICRSPMAAALLAARLECPAVRSAGLTALSGMPADPTAVRLMLLQGINIEAHRAQQLTGQLCQSAELILVMTLHQRNLIETEYPFTRGRVFRVAESGKRDVPDPFRKPEAAFREALAIIDEGVGQWVERICSIERKLR